MKAKTMLVLLGGFFLSSSLVDGEAHITPTDATYRMYQVEQKIDSLTIQNDLLISLHLYREQQIEAAEKEMGIKLP